MDKLSVVRTPCRLSPVASSPTPSRFCEQLNHFLHCFVRSFVILYARRTSISFCVRTRLSAFFVLPPGEIFHLLNLFLVSSPREDFQGSSELLHFPLHCKSSFVPFVWYFSLIRSSHPLGFSLRCPFFFSELFLVLCENPGFDFLVFRFLNVCSGLHFYATLLPSCLCLCFLLTICAFPSIIARLPSPPDIRNPTHHSRRRPICFYSSDQTATMLCSYGMHSPKALLPSFSFFPHPLSLD